MSENIPFILERCAKLGASDGSRERIVGYGDALVGVVAVDGALGHRADHDHARLVARMLLGELLHVEQRVRVKRRDELRTAGGQVSAHRIFDDLEQLL